MHISMFVCLSEDEIEILMHFCVRPGEADRHWDVIFTV